MNAFLVLTFLFLTTEGPVPFTVNVPFTSVAACEKYIESPEKIEFEFPGVVVGSDASCIPRQDGKPT